MGDMGVGVEGDIGDGELFADQEWRARQLFLHDVEGLVAADLLLFELGAAGFREAEVELDEARHGHIGLMAVLLEELPLQHLGAQARFAGQQGAAVGEEVEDGVGLPQATAVLQLQHRYLC